MSSDSESLSDLTIAKPKWRGVSHQFAAWAALVAGLFLIAISPTPRAALAAAIYAASLVALFGISAVYHRGHWKPTTRQRLRRLDHAAIYLLIAGSYTPIALLVVGDGGSLMQLAWVCAGLGVCKSLLWVNAPKALNAALFVSFGWMIVPYLSIILTTAGAPVLALIALGGAFHTLGAGVYALRRPDPFPGTFGYHEVFHLLVILASAAQFAAFCRIIVAQA